MPNIINFPMKQTKSKSKDRVVDPMLQPLTTEEAVNELTHQMLTELVRIYIDKNWSFRELDLIVSEFKDVMARNAPENLTRSHVDYMKDHMRPIWEEIVESIRSQYD